MDHDSFIWFVNLTPELLLVVPIMRPEDAIVARIRGLLEIVEVESPPGPTAGQLASHLERYSALCGNLAN